MADTTTVSKYYNDYCDKVEVDLFFLGTRGNWFKVQLNRKGVLSWTHSAEQVQLKYAAVCNELQSPGIFLQRALLYSNSNLLLVLGRLWPRPFWRQLQYGGMHFQVRSRPCGPWLNSTRPVKQSYIVKSKAEAGKFLLAFSFSFFFPGNSDDRNTAKWYLISEM